MDAARTLSDPESRWKIEAVLLALGALAARYKLSTLQRRFVDFAKKRHQAIAFATLLPIVVRLALLPAAPIPVPKIADEFGHLLVADTLAEGRITNPAHPLWEHFETLYILQQPSYASIYPIAQGAVLSLAKVIGLDPWFGVLLGVAFLCGATCWMLQAWLPPHWALVGALLTASRVAIDSYWINSYWGGAVAAGGGALVLGALPRMLSSKRVMDAIPMAVGFAILIQSRPFEGFLLSIPVAIWIAIRMIRQWRVIATLAFAAAVIAGGSLYYNRAVTGSNILPYQLHQKVYGTPQNLRWGAEVTDAPRANVHQDIRDNFEWQHESFLRQIPLAGLWKRVIDKMDAFWKFFLGPSLTIVLLVFAVSRPGMRSLFFTAVFVVVSAAILYPFFFPHYVAPVFSAVIAVAIGGLRRLRTAGPVIAVASFGASLIAGGGWVVCRAAYEDVTPRSRIEEQLHQLGGTHVVFVRYGSPHDFHKSWIYNAADVDGAPIVWARDMGTAANKEVLAYYKSRQAWLAEVDDPTSLLTPYSDADKPRVSAVINAAGKSPYFRSGVTPGSIVTISGRNLTNKTAGALTLPNDVCLFWNIGCRLGIPPADIKVRFGDYSAHVLSTVKNGSTESITVQVPSEVRTDIVGVSIQSASLERIIQLPVLAANPGLFDLKLRVDGSAVSSKNRARRGEMVRALVTGLGTNPKPAVIVGVNHCGATVRGITRAPAVKGYDVVAFEVPLNAPSGEKIPLSMAVVVNGKPVYSNNSSIAIE